MKHYIAIATLVAAIGCANPQPGPDKSAGGAVLGGAWGAGAGAVVGNQVSTSGLGAGAGAGFGAAAGLLTGIALDRMEGAVLDQQRQLDAIQARTRANFERLSHLQNQIDEQIAQGAVSGVYQVFFDADSTSLKSGAIANLQEIADAVKTSAAVTNIAVVGHTDDSGNPEYNKRLAEARAREVASYLGARGLSMDRIKVSHHGAERPVATNATPEGRQLNRRVDVLVGPN